MPIRLYCQLSARESSIASVIDRANITIRQAKTVISSKRIVFSSHLLVCKRKLKKHAFPDIFRKNQYFEIFRNNPDII
jgi:hypothetical protein